MGIALRTGRSNTDELILENPNGVKKYVQPHIKPLFNTSGNLLGLLCIYTDITQRYILKQKAKKAEVQLEISNRRMELQYQKMIAEVQDYAIIMLDADGNIINWNKGAEKIKGYTAEEIMGKNFRTFYFPEDVESKMPDRLIDEAARNGRAIHEGWRRRKDNSRFWGSIVITALHDDLGEVVGFTKVTRDLTERKLSEEKIKQYTLDLEAKNRELEQYASVASHDLQEPLRKIEVYAGLLKERIDNADAAKNYADKISGATHRMAKLVKEILVYTRTSPDEITEETDLNETLGHVVTDLELIIEEKAAKINTSAMPVIKGIPIQLYQLFYNIVSNSLKFSQGDPVITVSCEAASESDIVKYPELEKGAGYHKFTISDNGSGFSPEYAEKVFQMFERLDHNKKGSGIGLGLCRKIVHNHWGHILADSEENKGTDIIVYLPAG